jgi:hypothetical protein
VKSSHFDVYLHDGEGGDAGDERSSGGKDLNALPPGARFSALTQRRSSPSPETIVSCIQEEDRCRLRAALVAAQTQLTEKSNQLTRAYASLQLVVKPLQTKVIALEAQVVDLSRALEVQASKLQDAERQLSKAAAARNILIDNFTQLQAKSTDIVSHIMRHAQEIQEQAQRKQQRDYPKGLDKTHLSQQHQGHHKSSPNYSELSELWQPETGQDQDLARTTRSVEHMYRRTERRPTGRGSREASLESLEPPLFESLESPSLESQSPRAPKPSPSPSNLRPTVLTTRQATRENVLCGVGLVLGRMASEEKTVTTGGQSDICVLHLVPGSPAALSQKIQLDDRLCKIDNVRVVSRDYTHVTCQVLSQMREEGLHPVSSLQDVFRLIGGIEGSQITFEFARALKGGASARGTHYTFTVTLWRQKGDSYSSYRKEPSPAVAPSCSGARDYSRDHSHPSLTPKSSQLEPGVYEDHHNGYGPLAPGRVGSVVAASRGRYTGAGAGNASSACVANALLHQPAPLSWTQVRERVHAQNEANALVWSTTAQPGGRLPSGQGGGAVRGGSIAGEGGGDERGRAGLASVSSLFTYNSVPSSAAEIANTGGCGGEAKAEGDKTTHLSSASLNRALADRQHVFAGQSAGGGNGGVSVGAGGRDEEERDVGFMMSFPAGVQL